MYDINGQVLSHRVEIREDEISNNDDLLKKFSFKSIQAKMHRKVLKVRGKKRKVLLKSGEMDPEKIKEIKLCPDPYEF